MITVTKFYRDVKTPILAGMQFTYNKGVKKNNKIKKIGYDLVRLYYDSAKMDCLIAQVKIKRVMK